MNVNDVNKSDSRQSNFVQYGLVLYAEHVLSRLLCYSNESTVHTVYINVCKI